LVDTELFSYGVAIGIYNGSYGKNKRRLRGLGRVESYPVQLQKKQKKSP
jgi:hypothetical protein